MRASFKDDVVKVVRLRSHLGHITGLPSLPDSGTATAAGRCRACRPGTSCTRRRTCPANRLGICKEDDWRGCLTERLTLDVSELICLIFSSISKLRSMKRSIIIDAMRK